MNCLVELPTEYRVHLGQHTTHAPYVDPAIVWVANDDLRGSDEGGQEGGEGGREGRRKGWETYEWESSGKKESIFTDRDASKSEGPFDL